MTLNKILYLLGTINLSGGMCVAPFLLNTNCITSIKNSNVNFNDGKISQNKIIFSSINNAKTEKIKNNLYAGDWTVNCEATANLTITINPNVDTRKLDTATSVKTLVNDGTITSFNLTLYGRCSTSNGDDASHTWTQTNVNSAALNETIHLWDRDYGKNANYHAEVRGTYNFTNLTIKYDFGSNRFILGNYTTINSYAHIWGDGSGWSDGPWSYDDTANVNPSRSASLGAYVSYAADWFDFRKSITVDDKTRRWINITTNCDNIHAHVSCNVSYFEAALGNYQTYMWTKNNAWVNQLAIPSDVRTWLISHADVLDAINAGIIGGKLWDHSISNVDVYQIPLTQIQILNNTSYVDTGTYDDPNTHNSNALVNLISYAYANKSASNIITLINNNLSNIPVLSWSKFKVDNGYVFNEANSPYASVNDFKSWISTEINTLNRDWTLTLDYYGGDSKAQSNKFNTSSKVASFASFLNGLNLDPVKDGDVDLPLPYVDIRNGSLKYADGTDLTIYRTDGTYEIPKLKELDALDFNNSILYQGKSILENADGQTIAWDNDNWRQFLEDCKFMESSDLVADLTNGDIYIDGEEFKDSPLYHYTISNIDASMFCKINDAWVQYFGNDPDVLIKNITYATKPDSNNSINITITTNEGDTQTFDNSGWWDIEEQFISNDDPETLPDFSQTTVSSFLESIGNNGLTLLQSYTKWFNNSTLTKYLYKSNLTENEFENDLKTIVNPIVLIPNDEKGTLVVDVLHHQYYNSTTPLGDIVEEEFTISTFKPVNPPPPPQPLNPVTHPYMWIIYMLCGIVVGIGGGTATLLTVRAKRKRRKISTLTNKKIAKVEKTKSKQDVVNDISNKYKNDEIEK